MTFQYARLAVGRKKEYRGAREAVPLTENGKELPPMPEDELAALTWTKKVLEYEIRDEVMYCKLKGVK